MIVLDSTSKLVVFLSGAITTSNPEFVVSYADKTTTAVTPGRASGATNGTTNVDLVTAPAASTQRMIKKIVVHNKDTVSATVTIEEDISAARKRICKITLATLDTLEIDDEIRVIDSSGNLKMTLVIGANTVTDAMLRQGAARTVIGRSANSTGNVADISLAADGKFLGSRASALGAFYPTQRLSKSTTYALTQDDYGALVDCDTTSAGFTVTLPAPGTVGAGWWCTIRKTNSSTANVVTIARNASETINGASASNTLTSQYAYITLMCDGTNWAVLGVNDYLSSSNATPAGIGTAVTNDYADFTSLSVPPGEWDFSGGICFILNGGTLTQVVMGISAGTAGNSFTDAARGDNFAAAEPPAAAYDKVLTIPSWRKLFTATTTVYLKMRDSFTVQGLNVTGRLSARRVG